MPLPNPVEAVESSNRLAMQAAVFSCYLLVAIALLFSAWRMSASSEMIDDVMKRQLEIASQQTEILKEIKDARATIPAEVKSELKAAIPAVVKDALK